MHILGVDAGNWNGKVIGQYGEIIYRTAIAEYNPRANEKFGDDDMVVEFESRKYHAGTIAKRDTEFGGSIMGGSKAHSDVLLRVLMGIHRYMDIYNFHEIEFQIVVGQPIDYHVEDEKLKIINMLEKKHTITVNDMTKTFIITKVLVSKEVPFWSEPVVEKVRMIDIGSGTVNWSTFIMKKYISTESGTLLYGTESTKSKDRRAMARGIATETSQKWDKNDVVKLAGGGAYELEQYIKAYYPNTTILKPKISVNGGIKQLDPIFCNAVAFYNMAKGMFSNGENSKVNVIQS